MSDSRRMELEERARALLFEIARRPVTPLAELPTTWPRTRHQVRLLMNALVRTGLVVERAVAGGGSTVELTDLGRLALSPPETVVRSSLETLAPQPPETVVRRRVPA